MAARYIIFDGHIPVVFPCSFPFNSVSLGMLERRSVEKETSSGNCVYTQEQGWICLKTGGGASKQDAEILNRHLRN